MNRFLPDGFAKRIGEDEIGRSLDMLSERIRRDYSGRELLLVMVANGGIYFGVDLSRLLQDMSVLIDVVKVSSYIENQRTSDLRMEFSPKMNPKGCDVIIIDDVYDSGNTIEFLKRYYSENGASSVRSCVFINKRIDGRENGPDYFCREFSNEFAIGYGMDYDEHYRSLNCIGVKEE